MSLALSRKWNDAENPKDSKVVWDDLPAIRGDGILRAMFWEVCARGVGKGVLAVLGTLREGRGGVRTWSLVISAPRTRSLLQDSLTSSSMASIPATSPPLTSARWAAGPVPAPHLYTLKVGKARTPKEATSMSVSSKM